MRDAERVRTSHRESVRGRLHHMDSSAKFKRDPTMSPPPKHYEPGRGHKRLSPWRRVSYEGLIVGS